MKYDKQEKGRETPVAVVHSAVQHLLNMRPSILSLPPHTRKLPSELVHSGNLSANNTEKSRSLSTVGNYKPCQQLGSSLLAKPSTPGIK